MMFGIDLAIMAGSFIGGMIQKSMDNKHEANMAREANYQKDVQRVRLIKNEYFQFTRRIIALMAMSYIFLGPIAAMMWGYDVFIMYQESNSWITSLFSGENDTNLIEVPNGFVLTLLHRYIAESVVFLYFGRK